jgi:replicative DNA helicase
MTKNADYVERAGERLGAEDFVDPGYRAIFEALLDDPELRAPPSGMDPEAARRFQELLDDPEELSHAARVFDDAVARVRVAALDRRIGEVDRRIGAASDLDEKRVLTEEKIRLFGERRELAPDDWSTTARRMGADPDPNNRNR